MSLHYHQDYQCVKCETYFLPFQSPVTLCPECGEPNLQAEEFRDVLTQLVEANAAHRRMYGHFTPPAYGIFSLLDHYVYYSANVFDRYLDEHTPKAQIIEETIVEESNPWQDHLRELLSLLFEMGERRHLFLPSDIPADQQAGTSRDGGEACA